MSLKINFLTSSQPFNKFSNTMNLLDFLKKVFFFLGKRRPVNIVYTNYSASSYAKITVNENSSVSSF